MSKPYLIVLGNKGIGKSYLLCQIFGTQLFMHNKNLKHVTTSQKTETFEHAFFAAGVDTVGLDSKSSNVVSLAEFRGRDVVLLFLNNDHRIEESLSTLRIRLGLREEDSIAIFHAHSFNPEDDICYKGETVLKCEDILAKINDSSFIQKYKFRLYQNDGLPKPSMKKKKNNKKKTGQRSKQQKAELFENRFSALGDNRIRRCVGWKDDKMSDADIKNGLESITLPEVKKYREEGDGWLKVMIERLVAVERFPEKMKKQIQTNRNLQKFMESICGGEENVRNMAKKLYEQNNAEEDVSEEKIADMVEALLAKTCSFGLLDAIIKHHNDAYGDTTTAAHDNEEGGVGK